MKPKLTLKKIILVKEKIPSPPLSVFLCSFTILFLFSQNQAYATSLMSIGKPTGNKPNSGGVDVYLYHWIKQKCGKAKKWTRKRSWNQWGGEQVCCRHTKNSTKASKWICRTGYRLFIFWDSSAQRCYLREWGWTRAWVKGRSGLWQREYDQQRCLEQS